MRHDARAKHVVGVKGESYIGGGSNTSAVSVAAAEEKDVRNANFRRHTAPTEVTFFPVVGTI